MLSELVAKGEKAEYAFESPIMEVNKNDMQALLCTLFDKAIPWLEQKG
jgi:hypothetical protein